ncbi:TPR-like protein [Stipitochalara longipes BDJ]|nr:TPR-like protein [Stipitochalara longipes BDJ]
MSGSALYVGQQIGKIEGNAKVEFTTNIHGIYPSPPHRPADLPPLDSNFVGREETLEEIREKFKTGTIITLTGIASVGKSQIARKYCNLFKEQHPESRVFWVNFNTLESCDKSFREIGRELRIPGLDAPTVDPKRDVCAWLSKEANGKWLLVLDNADDAAVFAAFEQRIPVENGFILVTLQTSKQPELLGRNQPAIDVEVGELGTAYATQLFRSAATKDIKITEQQLKKLLDLLCHHPLAIVQAATYLSKGKREVANYIKDLENDVMFADSLDQKIDGRLRSLYTTLELTFNRISKKENQALEILLAQMGYIYPQDIPESLLLEDGEKRYSWDDALETLERYSLLGRPINKTRSMQRLIQTAIVKWLEIPAQKDVKKAGFEQAVAKCAHSFPSRPEFSDWESCESLYPHAQVILRSRKRFGEDEELTKEVGKKALSLLARLSFNMAWYEWRQGRYDAGTEHSHLAYQVQKELRGENDADCIRSLTLKAQILHHRGKYRQAKRDFDKAIDLANSKEWDKLEDKLEAWGIEYSLALTLIELKDFNQAKEKLERVLKRRRSTRDDKPDDIVALEIEDALIEDALAGVLCAQGKFKEAEKLTRQVLKKLTNLLGEKNPQTLAIMVHLANILQECENPKGAEDMLRQASQLYEEMLKKQGRESDPDLLICWNDLGVVLMEQREYNEAEKYLSRVWEGYEKKAVGAVGKEKNEEKNEQRVTVMINLAYVLEEIPDKRGALTDVLESMDKLALGFRNENRLEDAESLRRRALNFRSRNLSWTHRDTQKSWGKVRELSDVYWDEGRKGDALRLAVMSYILFIYYWILSQFHPEGRIQAVPSTRESGGPGVDDGTAQQEETE